MHPIIADIYRRYNGTLRPIISEIEGRNESFPGGLLNDIAAMYDTIALCESEKNDDARNQMANRALTYFKLGVSHGYQYLIQNLDERMHEFDKKCSPSVQAVIDDGRFIGEYGKLQKEAGERVRIGRRKDDVEALADWEAAYNLYIMIEKMIDRKIPVQIMQHTRKKSIFWIITGYAVSIVISVILGKLTNAYADEIFHFISTWKNALVA